MLIVQQTSIKAQLPQDSLSHLSGINIISNTRLMSQLITRMLVPLTPFFSHFFNVQRILTKTFLLRISGEIFSTNLFALTNDGIDVELMKNSYVQKFTDFVMSVIFVVNFCSLRATMNDHRSSFMLNICMENTPL